MATALKDSELARPMRCVSGRLSHSGPPHETARSKRRRAARQRTGHVVSVGKNRHMTRQHHAASSRAILMSQSVRFGAECGYTAALNCPVCSLKMVALAPLSTMSDGLAVHIAAPRPLINIEQETGRSS